MAIAELYLHGLIEGVAWRIHTVKQNTESGSGGTSFAEERMTPSEHKCIGIVSD